MLDSSRQLQNSVVRVSKFASNPRDPNSTCSKLDLNRTVYELLPQRGRSARMVYSKNRHRVGPESNAFFFIVVVVFVEFVVVVVWIIFWDLDAVVFFCFYRVGFRVFKHWKIVDAQDAVVFFCFYRVGFRVFEHWKIVDAQEAVVLPTDFSGGFGSFGFGDLGDFRDLGIWGFEDLGICFCWIRCCCLDYIFVFVNYLPVTYLFLFVN